MMPPTRNSLHIHIQDSDRDAAASDALQGSVRVDRNGNIITLLTDSYNPLSFSPNGMTKMHTGLRYVMSDRDIGMIKRLGAGASSTVHKAFFFKENKFVAVKKISVLERVLRKQMLNDIKAFISMPNLPNLIQFFGAFHVPNNRQISIVIEYMDGGSLADVLRKVQRIPEDVLSKFTAKILVGLSCLHKKTPKHMVHRDIKPANILLNLEGEAKITDFGISKFLDSSIADCHSYLGTVTYMSPERIENKRYGTAADIWSLGLSLVECATGKYPYDAPLGALDLMLQVMKDKVPIPSSGDFSAEFLDFVTLCLNKDPAARPTADALLQHAYITKYAASAVDLKAFMQCMLDLHDKLDEVAVLFTWNYYAIINAGVDRMKTLENIYSSSSILIHEGHKALGRSAIMQWIHHMAQQHAGSNVVYRANHVDCQPLGTDGSALVHVHGLRIATLGSSVPINRPFSECFILSQIQPGKYYVSSQTFRLLG